MRSTDPNARPIACVAERAKAASSYVGRLRDSVCMMTLDRQKETLASLPPRPKDVAVLEMSFDETEIHISVVVELKEIKKVKVTHSEVPVMITHGTLAWPNQQDIPIVCPAAGLHTKTAQDMLQVLHDNMAMFGGLAGLAAKVKYLVLIIISDAAKSNRLMLRHLIHQAGINTLLLHLLCLMHQVSLAVGACYVPWQALGPIFCGTNLLRRGKWLAQIGSAVSKYVSTLDVTYNSPQSDNDLRYAVDLLNLLEWDEEAFDGDEDLQRRSMKKADRKLSRLGLAKFLSGSWNSKELRHNCILGCCECVPQSQRKLSDYLLDTLLLHMPPVPALNRWTKLFGMVDSRAEHAGHDQGRVDVGLRFRQCGR